MSLLTDDQVRRFIAWKAACRALPVTATEWEIIALAKLYETQVQK